MFNQVLQNRPITNDFNQSKIKNMLSHEVPPPLFLANNYGGSDVTLSPSSFLGNQKYWRFGGD